MALTVVQAGVGGTGTTSFPSPGTSGNVLTSNGSAWTSSTPAAGGKVLQVVQTVLTSATSVNTSGGFAEISGLATSITPISASSKILVMMTISGGASNGYRSGIKLVRNSTDIFIGDSGGSRLRTTVFQKNVDGSNQASYNPAFIGMDSPSTTSSVTYRVYASVENVNTFYVNQTASDTDLSSHYRAASSLVLMEIAG